MLIQAHLYTTKSSARGNVGGISEIYQLKLAHEITDLYNFNVFKFIVRILLLYNKDQLNQRPE